MKDNVLIKIKTYQDIEGSGDEPIELETTGRFGSINGKYYIMYDESELTGFADTSTMIKIWDKSVMVTRRGKHNMKISYTEGERNLCVYPTPYGSVGASIRTFDVSYDLDCETPGGSVRVDYTLDTDNENFYKNSLNIIVEPLNKSENEHDRVSRSSWRAIN